MATTYVALDLETTGLDFRTDAIIEVGAVRFDGDGVRHRYSTLVNPRRPLPPRIQELTGIRDEELRQAPPLEAITQELEAFLHGAVIVGHNVVGFDVRFLDAASIRYGESLYDTFDLATLLLPGLTQYSLAALAAHFQIDFPVQHRALADAEATRDLFLALQEQALQLQPNVLGQVAQWLTPTAWPWRGFFPEVWEMAQASAPAGGRPFRLQPPTIAGPLSPRSRPEPVPVEQPLAVLASGQRQPEALPQFEERPEQQAMVRAVNEALNEGQRLLVEAGTGTGKSLAYLIPAACEALTNDRRVVISTATINLQDQLTGKDLPALRALLPDDSTELRACQLKGRRNYLCLRRFAALQASPSLSDDEAHIAARILIWLTQTETGDRGELRLTPAEETIWRRLSAEGADCSVNNSPFMVEGTCFLQRARRRAESSHIVVVNHSLLLSDIASEGRVLPPYDHLVVDEAHHLEEEATRQFGFTCRESEVAELLDRMEGLSPSLRGALGGADPLGPAGQITGTVDAVRRAARGTRSHHQELSRQLLAFLRQQAGGAAEQEPRLLITRGMRVQPDWSGVEMAWENLGLSLREALGLLDRLQAALSETGESGVVNSEMLLAEVDALRQEGQALVDGLAVALERDDPERVVWLERERGDGSLVVAWAPLHVDETLRTRLYDDRSSVILTGATLTSQGSFDYLRERLGLEDAQTLAMDSPFDFQGAALVLVPHDMPEPSQSDYLDALGRAIVDLARASAGRALVLFTSHATLRASHAFIREPLQREGIAVMGQGIDGSPRYLVRYLQSNPRSVILGTASFWEGIDVVGEALSLLIIARLPFTVPTEPVFAARSALYDEPFTQYAVPQATLRFRQGFGRLIRSKTDRGVLVVLDRRIVSKRYGSAFLDSLPGCSKREVMLREMPALVQQWLGPGEHTREVE